MWVPPPPPPPPPRSLKSYSLFIYLQLSAGAQADKQLQLPERLMPQPGHYLIITECMIKYVVLNPVACKYQTQTHTHTHTQTHTPTHTHTHTHTHTNARTAKQDYLPSRLALNFHTEKCAHSAVLLPLHRWKLHFPLWIIPAASVSGKYVFLMALHQEISTPGIKCNSPSAKFVYVGIMDGGIWRPEVHKSS